ncbi:hypothetical protein BDV96DRAFT_652398 [Lophiotrema nucula]|uniref:Heterokaryon incompatibility domain-containing protein n=1 Tax=Lophiotrema nucula TaxID=690887 RepID=A0A6A5YPB0_9PLEO|nr:hypothetical protein BDV96DRAFT_652398 [Lophiotrema nucula]
MEGLVDAGGSQTIQVQSLIYLLNESKCKECHIIRDRVFSLIALCGDAQFFIVDYSGLNRDIARNVFEATKSTACLCAIHVVGDALEIEFCLSQDVSAEKEEKEHLYYFSLHLPLKWSLHPDATLSECVESGYRELRQHLYCPPELVHTLPTPPGSRILCSSTHGQELHRTVRTIIIKLNQICETYTGYVVLQVNPAMDGFSYQYFEEHSYQKWMPLHADSGLNIHDGDGGDECVISLSFDFWLYLVRLAKASNAKFSQPGEGEGFCDHVANRNSLLSGSTGRLRLYLGLKGTSSQIESSPQQGKEPLPSV